jgi:hypothetical protein
MAESDAGTVQLGGTTVELVGKFETCDDRHHDPAPRPPALRDAHDDGRRHLRGGAPSASSAPITAPCAASADIA